ncbi:MAG: class I SAM-dependent methyltransferase [Nitrospirota bacterium]|nr:class I SAM-dependent methyltransferase [Nitrospirota bacterium]
MHSDKYYDWSCQRVLNEADGCRYEDWENKSDDFPFAIHPEGFPIFLSPQELYDSDEYSEGDPYALEGNIEDEFHRQRIDSTLYLLKAALDEKISAPKILDIGCGQGHITAEIKKNFPDAEISGLDYSVSAISYAANKFSGIDFCVADACNPPYCREYFDVVVCNNLWEHVPDPLLLLKAIRGILKSSGFLIVSTPSRYRFSNILRVLRGRRINLMSPHHVTEYSVGQVMEQLKWGGFEVKEIYSKPVSSRAGSVKAMVAYHLILPIMRTYLRVMNSDHILENTAFFLAEKGALQETV